MLQMPHDPQSQASRSHAWRSWQFASVSAQQPRAVSPSGMATVVTAGSPPRQGHMRIRSVDEPYPMQAAYPSVTGPVVRFESPLTQIGRGDDPSRAAAPTRFSLVQDDSGSSTCRTVTPGTPVELPVGAAQPRQDAQSISLGTRFSVVDTVHRSNVMPTPIRGRLTSPPVLVSAPRLASPSPFGSPTPSVRIDSPRMHAARSPSPVKSSVAPFRAHTHECFLAAPSPKELQTRSVQHGNHSPLFVTRFPSYVVADLRDVRPAPQPSPQPVVRSLNLQCEPTSCSNTVFASSCSRARSPVQVPCGRPATPRSARSFVAKSDATANEDDSHLAHEAYGVVQRQPTLLCPVVARPRSFSPATRACNVQPVARVRPLTDASATSTSFDEQERCRTGVLCADRSRSISPSQKCVHGQTDHPLPSPRWTEMRPHETARSTQPRPASVRVDSTSARQQQLVQSKPSPSFFSGQASPASPTSSCRNSFQAQCLHDVRSSPLKPVGFALAKPRALAHRVDIAYDSRTVRSNAIVKAAVAPSEANGSEKNQACPPIRSDGTNSYSHEKNTFDEQRQSLDASSTCAPSTMSQDTCQKLSCDSAEIIVDADTCAHEELPFQSGTVTNARPQFDDCNVNAHSTYAAADASTEPPQQTHDQWDELGDPVDKRPSGAAILEMSLLACGLDDADDFSENNAVTSQEQTDLRDPSDVGALELLRDTSTAKARCASNHSETMRCVKSGAADDQVVSLPSEKTVFNKSTLKNVTFETIDLVSPPRKGSSQERLAQTSAQGADDSVDEKSRRHVRRRTSLMFDAAMSRVVPEEEARHPQRAGPGHLLLQRAKPAYRGECSDQQSADMVRELFLDSMPQEFVQIESIEMIKQPELLKRFLKKVAEERASVETTFHGTREEFTAIIAEEGLNANVCQTGAYGIGAYVGTHAGVAHQYADPNDSGLRHMYLVLVVAGSRIVKGHQAEQYTVTAGDQLTNPTQYCFVDEQRLFISHLIRYRVIGTGGRKRIGGGWSDPFQTKLSAAIRRAALLERKHGAR
eukprot:TRINITY_DN26064_c0_g2_i1.p1 TRINITY_DN26064_c0_g2~~TRINITY_DN26064_c0_g2_i1.p1  ORF type:complete len:1036 (+),score=63.86 TRINITY_DN26064_c0_g2_i1:61-3168(+)